MWLAFLAAAATAEASYAPTATALHSMEGYFQESTEEGPPWVSGWGQAGWCGARRWPREPHVSAAVAGCHLVLAQRCTCPSADAWEAALRPRAIEPAPPQAGATTGVGALTFRALAGRGCVRTGQ